MNILAKFISLSSSKSYYQNATCKNTGNLITKSKKKRENERLTDKQTDRQTDRQTEGDRARKKQR